MAFAKQCKSPDLNYLFELQRNPAIAHFKGPTDFMPYCGNALLPYDCIINNKAQRPTMCPVIDVGGGGLQGLQLEAHFVVQSISVVNLEREK